MCLLKHVLNCEQHFFFSYFDLDYPKSWLTNRISKGLLYFTEFCNNGLLLLFLHFVWSLGTACDPYSYISQSVSKQWTNTDLYVNKSGGLVLVRLPILVMLRSTFLVHIQLRFDEITCIRLQSRRKYIEASHSSEMSANIWLLRYFPEGRIWNLTKLMLVSCGTCDGSCPALHSMIQHSWPHNITSSWNTVKYVFNPRLIFTRRERVACTTCLF
jgi:hypothetical protein